VAADQAGTEFSESYRQRYLQGEPGAVDEFLRRHPESIHDLWVRDAVVEIVQSGSYSQRRGRPSGRSDEVLGFGTAVMAYVDWQMAAGAKSRSAVFRELERGGFGSLSYEGIRALDRRTRTDDRLRPVMFTVGDRYPRTTAPEPFDFAVTSITIQIDRGIQPLSFLLG
jgi:hypothetical protein